MGYPLAKEAFREQVKKIRANYGDQNFSEGRAALVWEELKEFSPKQIKSICDVLIGECQFAPILCNFREKAGLLREKIRQWEREQDRLDSVKFYGDNPSIPQMENLL